MYKTRDIIKNAIFLFSTTILTAYLSLEHSMTYILWSVSFAFLLQLVLLLRYNYVIKIHRNKNNFYVYISILFSIITLINIKLYLDDKIAYILEKINFISMSETLNVFLIYYGAFIISFLCFYAIYTYWYYCFSNYYLPIKNFMCNLDLLGKKFLLTIAIISLVSILIIYGNTNLFYSPTTNGDLMYDVVYTTDTGFQTSTNIYMNISARDNDLRQPLFGLFALPFGVLATIFSACVFFIPHSYSISLAIIHSVILGITLILLTRLLKLKSINKLLFLFMFIFTYPSLLYLLNLEQYILALFWLICFLYSYINGKKNKVLLFIASTGSLVTTGILFPLLYEKGQIIQSVKKIFNAGFQFLALIIICGKLPLILNYKDYFSGFVQYTGVGVTFIDRVYQYLNFIASCFIKPTTIIDKVTYGHISYQMAPVIDINKVGLIILILTLLGFITNRKIRYAQICFFWVLYSFILLCIVGWGTSENGLIIYTLYFSWAFISLIYMLINKVLKKDFYKRIVLLSIISVLLLINLPGIWDLICFGMQYFF